MALNGTEVRNADFSWDAVEHIRARLEYLEIWFIAIIPDYI
jgi:hypothetical protein